MAADLGRGAGTSRAHRPLPRNHTGAPSHGAARTPRRVPLKLPCTWKKCVRFGLTIAASATVLSSPDARADGVPTGLPPSPTFGIQKFTQPMPRFDVLQRQAVSTLNPPPTAESNQTQQPVDPALGGGTGPIEGRPPGPIWAHQGFDTNPPKVAYDV